MVMMDDGGEGRPKVLILTDDSCCCSYVIGMVLSILGTVMLIIGSTASFAGATERVLRDSR